MLLEEIEKIRKNPYLLCGLDYKTIEVELSELFDYSFISELLKIDIRFYKLLPDFIIEESSYKEIFISEYFEQEHSLPISEKKIFVNTFKQSFYEENGHLGKYLFYCFSNRIFQSNKGTDNFLKKEITSIPNENINLAFVDETFMYHARSVVNRVNLFIFLIENRRELFLNDENFYKLMKINPYFALYYTNRFALQEKFEEVKTLIFQDDVLLYEFLEFSKKSFELHSNERLLDNFYNAVFAPETLSQTFDSNQMFLLSENPLFRESLKNKMNCIGHLSKFLKADSRIKVNSFFFSKLTEEQNALIEKSVESFLNNILKLNFSEEIKKDIALDFFTSLEPLRFQLKIYELFLDKFPNTKVTENYFLDYFLDYCVDNRQYAIEERFEYLFLKITEEERIIFLKSLMNGAIAINEIKKIRKFLELNILNEDTVVDCLLTIDKEELFSNIHNSFALDYPMDENSLIDSRNIWSHVFSYLSKENSEKIKSIKIEYLVNMLYASITSFKDEIYTLSPAIASKKINSMTFGLEFLVKEDFNFINKDKIFKIFLTNEYLTKYMKEHKYSLLSNLFLIFFKGEALQLAQKIGYDPLDLLSAFIRKKEEKRKAAIKIEYNKSHIRI